MRDGYEDAEPAMSWVNPAPLGKYAMREDCMGRKRNDLREKPRENEQTSEVIGQQAM